MTTWAGFPMGFRFTVDDFSVETKRACWQRLLSSLGGASYKQVLLFEKETASACDRRQGIYLCILSHKPIKQSRANAKHFLSDPLLMSSLSVFAPIIQENALNLEAPDAALIGLVKANGEIACEDAGKDILPSVLPRRDIPLPRRNVLIAPGRMGAWSASELAKRIGIAIAEAETRYRPHLLPVGDGGAGTMLSLAAGTRGRILPTLCRNARGTPVPASFAVLPDGRAVVECAYAADHAPESGMLSHDRSSHGVGDLVRSAAGHGYASILVCAGGIEAGDRGEGMLQALGLPCVGEEHAEPPSAVASASITVLDDRAPGDDGACSEIAAALRRACGARVVSGAEYVLDKIGFDAWLKRVDAVVTAGDLSPRQGMRDGSATKAIIDRCERAHVPCLLLAEVTADDDAALPDAGPSCAGLFPCDGGGDGLQAGISRLITGLNAMTGG